MGKNGERCPCAPIGRHAAASCTACQLPEERCRTTEIVMRQTPPPRSLLMHRRHPTRRRRTRPRRLPNAQGDRQPHQGQGPAEAPMVLPGVLLSYLGKAAGVWLCPLAAAAPTHRCSPTCICCRCVESSAAMRTASSATSARMGTSGRWRSLGRTLSASSTGERDRQ